ncbi:MAG: cysteine desulfurase family protein [Candidatus Puniceispirillum sp.]
MTGLYMDNNATTPLRPAAATAMQDAMGPPANPSSVHGFGRSARLIVETARESVAALAGCRPADVVFTSGGTEANNIAFSGFSHIITSAIEHDSVLQHDKIATIIPVDQNGVVALPAVKAALDAVDPAAAAHTLLSIMAANNETGVLQPIAEIAEMAAAAGIAFHSDMVQICGKSHIDLGQSGISFASVSAHKIGGPTGVGALLVRPGAIAGRLLYGGGQEQGRRAGTENLIGIAGFGAAAADAFGDIGHFVRMAAWRDAFETKLITARRGIEIFGKAAPRLGNTSCVAAAGKTAETMVMAFDIAKVAISAGSACSSGKVKPSHVLTAMNAGARAAEAIRISGGWATQQADFEKLADVFLRLYKQTD